MKCLAITPKFRRCRNDSETGKFFCYSHAGWLIRIIWGAIIVCVGLCAGLSQIFDIKLPNPLATKTPLVLFTETQISTNTPSILMVTPALLSTYTSTPSDILNSTPTSILLPTPIETVFFDANTYHVGDTIEWLPLDGECKNFDFVVQLPIDNALLNVEIFDANESALIKINDAKASIIPISPVDETWSEEKSIPLPISLFKDGVNRLEFCSVIGREGLDLDDFQIRNISIGVGVIASASCSANILSRPLHLEDTGIASEDWKDLSDKYILRDKDFLRITYDLHGLIAQVGERKDDSVIVFNQPNWYGVSLTIYGANGFDGKQTLNIPLAAFLELPNPDQHIEGGRQLDLNKPVSTIRARFWHQDHYNVDIISVYVCALP